MKNYFNIFYKYNENFSQEFTYTYRRKTTKLSLEVYLNSGKKHLKITLVDERKSFQNHFGGKIETGFSLSEKVENNSDDRIFENKSKFIKEILLAIKQIY